jgi:AAA+ superfamily predicted ATPase
MTKELYEEVKDEIPAHIGVYLGYICKKRAKKQELKVDEQILKNSLIRSLYREAEKVFKSDNPTIVDSLKRQVNNAKKDAEDYKHKYWELMRIGQEKYGNRWYKE